MKHFVFILFLLLGLKSFAEDNSSIKSAMALFSEGKYQATILELSNLESQLSQTPESNKQKLGLISYWKGICHNRLQEFPEAIKYFNKALVLDYAPVDINYEYGQALFASEKLSEARLQFRESLKRKHKRGVSLYYIGYISKELGDLKKAYTFFRSINKLSSEESSEVMQASEMQIGDIYLEQVEKRADAFKAVESYVVPQYQKAYEMNKESTLAPLIQKKIVNLQRKYDLIMFQLSNGRPTLNPPYFMRLSQEFGQDTNVTFSPAETTISSAKQASLYSRTDLMGRYTFYHRDFLSISPEFRFNRTHYFNRVPEIYRNDNQLLAPSLRLAHEHTLWDRPASTLLDYEYQESRRDVEGEKNLTFSSRSHNLMLGERFNYFNFGESIIRLRHRMLESYESASDSKTTSLVLEQIKGFTLNTLLLYFSYDRMRVNDESFDTDSLTLRGDFIMAKVKNWFTPSFGLSLTSTDPINDRARRGRELLINPNARLSKSFQKHWRANLKYDYQKNSSKDEENFAYTKSVYALEVEYLF